MNQNVFNDVNHFIVLKFDQRVTLVMICLSCAMIKENDKNFISRQEDRVKRANFILFKVIDTLASNFKALETFEDYNRCFNKLNDFDENDIFEIRHDSDWVSRDQSDGASIHVSIIDVCTRRDLLFGRKYNLDWITIDSPYNAGRYGGDGNYCLDDMEAAASIKIKNGVIIESECPPRK